MRACFSYMKGELTMNGRELKLLLTINEVKGYDVAQAINVSQTIFTRRCQPHRELKPHEKADILHAIERLKGAPLVTTLDLTDCVQMDNQTSINN
jgi:hypothetical protein